MKRYLLFLLFCISLCSLRAEEQALYTPQQQQELWKQPDFVKAYLVVTDPGDVLYSILGHACIHLVCEAYDLDYYFTYESENVRNRVLSFLAGNLKMGMFAMESEAFLNDYRKEGRGMREYPMSLPIDTKRELWRFMDNKVMEGANLPYDYFYRGCAKSVVNVMNNVIAPKKIDYTAIEDSRIASSTMRELVRSAISHSIEAHLLDREVGEWTAFILYFFIGVDGDRSYPVGRKLIVPNDLVYAWQNATLDGEPLLSTEPIVILPSEPHDKQGFFTPLLFSLLVLLVALVGWLGKKYCRPLSLVADSVVLVVVTVLGAFMTYLVCFSHLPCTDWNWLIIPFNILPVIAWKWRQYWAFPYAGILVLWLLAMIIVPCQLVGAAHIILTLALILILVKNGYKLVL